VSRSKEAKEIGIPMGAPAFQIQELVKRYNVYALSSNFDLYGDMSLRVMQTLSTFSPDMEEYSIDEAFLQITSCDPLCIAIEIKNTVYKNTGIPVSVGIGKTKTLAKVAGDLAKKKADGCFVLHNNVDETLQSLTVEEIWGVGRRLSTQLKSYRIFTALDLKNADDTWIKNVFSVVLLRTVWELRGIECLKYQEGETSRKSITSSRSFGKPVTELKDLEEAVSSYMAKAATKLRNDGSVASQVCVFINTSRFKEDSYYNYQILTLPQATDYTPHLVSFAKQALHHIFKPGYVYKKAGITLLNLSPKGSIQTDLFAKRPADDTKHTKAMSVLDKIQHKMGKESISFASEGIEKSWKMKKESSSPRYTTRWDEILTIKI